MLRKTFAWVGVFLVGLAFVAISDGADGLAGQPAQNPSQSVVQAPTEVGEYMATEQGCPALFICGYSQKSYTGIRYGFTCNNPGEIGGAYMRSARNRCGDRANYLMIGLGNLACMNPGGNRPSPGLFTSVVIRALGSRC